MRTVIKNAHKIATSEVKILILGETGTGKELIANAIHQGSLRSQKPLRVVNSGALPETIVVSTLFGHKKGALLVQIKIIQVFLSKLMVEQCF
jgi:transcriptional regulator with PAS, ATPase and Fis domain